MDGKAAMALVLFYPEKVRRLAVMDIAPIAHAYSQHEYVDAMKALDLAGLKTRGGAVWRFTALIPQPGLRAFFLSSLDLRADPPRWKMNLDVLLASVDALTGWPKSMAGRCFDGPVLAVCGAQPDYATEAGRAAYLDMRLAPGVRFLPPDDHEDRGIHVTEGADTMAG